MHVSIEIIRNKCMVSNYPLDEAKDAKVSEQLIAVAESVVLPIAFVTGVSHSHLSFTNKGAQYIVINAYEESDEAELLSTLRHELVHYDQVMRGDLKSTISSAVQWKGETFFTIDTPVLGKPNSAEDAAMQMASLARYLAQPWEWEASVHELDRIVGPILARAFTAAHEQIGTVWSDSWDQQTFMTVLADTRSMSEAYYSVTGIMIKQ